LPSPSPPCGLDRRLICLLACPTTDRHQSFKLRLPSIRRDIRCKARAIEKVPDPENPPIPEESVPLSHLESQEGLSRLDRDSPAGHESFTVGEERFGELGPEGERLIDMGDEPGDAREELLLQQRELRDRWKEDRDDTDSGEIHIL
jgi:hypothetical protein